MPAYLWIILACVAIFALCAVAYIAYASEVAIAHARVEAREVAALSAACDLIGDTLQSVNRDLVYLLGTEKLRIAIHDETPASKQALGEEWLAYSHSKAIYDKIRWLDEHGKERVRINNNHGTPRLVPEDRLQSRALRYFFQDAFALSQHEVYVSPFDLNIEGETIELPYKPTIRIGTPLFNDKGERRGVLLLNYLGSDLFARITQAAADVAPHLWLVNAQGYWLRSNTPGNEWGFMFNRPDLSLASRHPAAWQKITAQQSGQFTDDAGLWTFDTVNPVQEGQTTSAGSGKVFSPSREMSGSGDYFWKAVTFIPNSQRSAIATPNVGGSWLPRLGFRLRQLTRRLGTAHHVHSAEQSLHEHLAAQVFEYTNEGVMITDTQMRIIMTNPAFTQITGYSKAEAIGRPPTMLQPGTQGGDLYKNMWAMVLISGVWQGEVWNRRKSGEPYAEWLSITALRDQLGNVSHYLGVFSDITQVKQSAERMEFVAHHDALTGLPNRRLLTARMEHSIQLAQRNGSQFALMFLDLDHFKMVNDQLGHEAGDALLKDVAERLSSILRAEDTLARLGGDEFVILLENTGAEAHISRVAEAILQQFPCSVSAPSGQIDVTVSIGVSLYPRDGDTPATLLGSADHAMYRAKQGGRNSAVMADLVDNAAAAASNARQPAAGNTGQADGA